MSTRDQKFAKIIYGQVKEIAKRSQVEQNKYGSMAHKLPILIRTAGLVQALAFVEARTEDVQKELLSHIATTIGLESREILLERSRTTSLEAYMRLTQQVLASLLWYKRFAQSVLGVEAGDEADTKAEEEHTNVAESS